MSKIREYVQKSSLLCASRSLLLHNLNLLDIRMVWVLRVHHALAHLHMVRTTKQCIHLLEADLLCLRDEEPHERREQDVDACEEVEHEEAAVVEEDGEELLHDGVDDVLGLRAHADSLRTYVHGEDFRGIDPHGSTPGRLVW